MLPFDFWIAGPPLSYQASDKQRLRAWMGTVRDAATRLWPPGAPPVVGRLRLTVWHFHEGVSTRRDNDNLVKPIQDALNGLVYGDDRQIISTRVEKRSLDEPIIVRGVSPVMAQGLSNNKEFVYVKIELAPQFERLAP